MTEPIRVGAIEIRFLQSGAETAGTLDMFEMTVPTAARVPLPHYHRDYDETIYGLAGSLTFTVEGEVHEIAPGTALFIRRGDVHGFVNRGAEAARCLAVLTPGLIGPAYFRELGALIAAPGPPDPARIREVMTRYGLVPVPP